MPRHMVMDHTGHDEKVWDKADVVGTQEAAKRFAELNSAGYTAVVPGPDGSPGTVIKAFDPDADVLFVPRLVGG